MNDTIKGWFAARGISLANDASDQAIVQALQKAWDANATAALANSSESLQSAVDPLNAKIITLENARLALETDVKTHRDARIAANVDLAITQGRLKVADRADKITTLTALDNAKLTEALPKLLTVPRLFKTVADTQSGKVLANAVENDNARTLYQVALENHCKATGETDPIKAHKAVMAANPQLGEAFKAKSTPAAKS